MFYGGRLLSHLSADEDDNADVVEDFIELRSLNRHLAVIIDSDRKKKSDSINSTKQRVVDAFGEDRGVAWVTQGREIENYVDPDLLTECAEQVCAGSGDGVGRELYEHAVPLRNEESNKRINKVKLARFVVEKKPKIDIHDLKSRIDEIINFINVANR
jgi:translation initiation factor IF-3